jgi:hypothetical protein
MVMKKYILLALLALAPAAFAQVSTRGTDFYVAFGNNERQTYSALDFQIRIVATEAATVTLTFNANTALNDVFTVNAGEVYTYPLNETQREYVYSDVTGTSNKSLRIQSTAPVSVYALNQYQGSTDATNVLPVGNLGTDYYQVSYRGSGAGSYSDGFTVVATRNSTNIHRDGQLRVTLDAGEVYSSYYSMPDTTGMHITSDYPIAYFVTNQCAQVPYLAASCDCLYQQMVRVYSKLSFSSKPPHEIDF